MTADFDMRDCIALIILINRNVANQCQVQLKNQKIS